MSKRNTILRFIVPVVILVLLSLASFYFYRKSNSVPAPLTQEQIEELQRKELMGYKANPDSFKTELEQKKELQSFKIPVKKVKLTEEEMRKILTNDEVKSLTQ